MFKKKCPAGAPVKSNYFSLFPPLFPVPGGFLRFFHSGEQRVLPGLSTTFR